MLTDDQKAHFHSLGFVVVPQALTVEEVGEFSRRFDVVANHASDDPSASGMRIFPDGHRVIVPLIEADPYFYNILDHPNLASIAEDVLGDDCIFYGSSDGQIHTGTTNWHQDGSWPEPSIVAKLTFYLDDVAPGKGCLSVIPGSHLWPAQYADLAKRVDDRIFGYPTDQVPGRYDLPTRKGDVIAFNTRLWHSSWGGGANRRQMAWMMATAPRMAWEVQRYTEFYRNFAKQWSPETGHLVSDRLFETASPQRMRKLRLLQTVRAQV